MEKIGNPTSVHTIKWGDGMPSLFRVYLPTTYPERSKLLQEFQASCYYMETGYTCDNALVFVNDRDRVKCAVYEPEHFTFTEGD